MLAKEPETHYRGQPIKAHALAVGGKLNRQMKVDNLDIGDTGQMLVSFTVVDMGHRHDDRLGGLIRKPKVSVTEAHLLDDGEGDQLLVELRERDDKLLDALLGRNPLPFDDTQTGEIPPWNDEPGESGGGGEG